MNEQQNFIDTFYFIIDQKFDFSTITISSITNSLFRFLTQILDENRILFSMNNIFHYGLLEIYKTMLTARFPIFFQKNNNKSKSNLPWENIDNGTFNEIYFII